MESVNLNFLSIHRDGLRTLAAGQCQIEKGVLARGAGSACRVNVIPAMTLPVHL